MGKLNLEDAPIKSGSIYPEPYGAQMAGRSSQRLGELGELTQFGANLVTLEPGAKSSLRHWHENEDEFVMVTQGSCTLIDNTGQHLLQVGDCAAFPAGSDNAHHFINQSNEIARFLVVGTKAPEERAHYPDNDMMVSLAKGQAKFTKANGDPL